MKLIMCSTRFNGKWTTRMSEDLEDAYLEDEIKRLQNQRKIEELLIKVRYAKMKKKEELACGLN